MTQQAKRVTFFDAWAAEYDTAVATGCDDFPFAGYDEVLATAVPHPLINFSQRNL